MALERTEEGCTLRLEGELTLNVATELKQALEEAVASGNATLDLEQVTSMDVSALQLFAAAARAGATSGGVLQAVNVPSAIDSGFNEAGFECAPWQK